MHDAAHPADAGPGDRPSALSAVSTPRRTWAWPTGRELRLAIVVPAVCLLLVLVLRIWVGSIGPFPGDRWAMTRNDFGGQPRSILDIGNFFQVAGTPIVSAITLAWAGFFVYRSEGRRGLVFLGLATCGLVFNVFLKELSGPTPLMRHSPGALNFPSGHTVYAVVSFGALAVMAWQRGRRDIASALVFFLVLMGPFRVTIGAHLVSDVIAAYLVGIAWLVPAAILTGYGSPRPRPQSG